MMTKHFKIWLESIELKPQKDVVYRKTDIGEWQAIIAGKYSGTFWSSNPNEYGTPRNGDVILLARRSGSISLSGKNLPKDREEQKRRFEAGELEYYNIDKKELSDIIAAYEVRDGQLIQIYSQ